MNNRIHRRGFAAVLLAAALMIAAALTGCGGKPTAQSLAKNIAEKMDSLKSCTLDEKVLLDVEIGAMGQTLDLGMDLGIGGDIIVEPYTSHLKMKLDMNMTGFNESSETTKMEMYSERDGEEVVTYTTQDGKSWEQSRQDMGDAALTGLLDMNIYNLIADGTVEAELAEETQEINGTEAYVLTFSLSGDQMEEFLSAATSVGGSELGMFENMDLTGVSVPVTLYVGKKDGYPVRMQMDMTEMGGSLFAGALGVSGQDYDINIRKFTVNVDMSGFNTIDRISIPEEVRSSAAAEEDAEEAPEEQAAEQAGEPEALPEETEGDNGEPTANMDGDNAELSNGDATFVITKPDGFDELRAGDGYVTADFYKDGAMTDVFYFLYDNITVDEYLDFTDASYMREDADYSNVVEGKIQSGTVGGKKVKWKKTSYDYSDLAFIKYEIGVPNGKGILSVEITCTNDVGTEMWFDENELLENVMSHIEVK